MDNTNKTATASGDDPRWDENGEPWNEAAEKVERERAAVSAATKPTTDLESIDQYQVQMAAISSAALGYWKESEGVKPEYDTVPLRDVAKLYAKYESLLATKPAAQAVPVAWGLLEIQEPELTNDEQLAAYWARKGRKVTPLYAAPLSADAAQEQALTDEQIKTAIVVALNNNTTEMEGYAYFGSNPGVKKDDYDDIADVVIRAIRTPGAEGAA